MTCVMFGFVRVGGILLFFFFFVFFFKQKTAYEIGTGDWSSDVCSSDLMNVMTHFQCVGFARLEHEVLLFQLALVL